MADLLTKICIICTLMGISLLIIVSDKIEIPESEISQITKGDIGKSIKISGIVKSIIKRGNSITLLEVQDKNSSIYVTIFKPNKNTIEKGSFVEISGKVSFYQGSLQIIADTIKT